MTLTRIVCPGTGLGTMACPAWHASSPSQLVAEASHFLLRVACVGTVLGGSLGTRPWQHGVALVSRHGTGPRHHGMEALARGRGTKP